MTVPVNGDMAEPMIAAPMTFMFEQGAEGAPDLVYASAALKRRLGPGAPTEAFWRAVAECDRAQVAASLNQAFAAKTWRTVLRLAGQTVEATGECDGEARLIGQFTPLVEDRAALVDALNCWRWRSGADGRLVELSSNYETLVGEPAAPMIGLRRQDIALAYDDPAAQQASANIGARRPFTDLRFQRRTADGRVIWVRSAGEPLFDGAGDFQGYLGVSRDVTHEVDANTRHALLAAILAHAPIGLLLVNADRRIVFFNEEFSRLLGAAADVLTPGLHVRDFLRLAVDHGAEENGQPLDDAWIEQRLAGLFRGPTVAEHYIGDNWVEMRSSPLAQGGFVIAGIDFDDRRRLQEQLVHSQRLEATGRLTAGVAHDFNNLLAVIMGNLELMKLGADPELTPELIASALTATQRGALLTRQLLSFGRRATLSPKVLDANAVVQEMRPMFDRTLPASISLITDLDADLAATRLDRRQLESALLNLVLNARDAMPEGGRLMIETRNMTFDQTDVEMAHSTLAPGAFVMITVADDGAGMQPEVAAMAFEPFFTTKSLGEGSGLGLSMVFGFAKQSGGDATIYSEPGRGSAIRLYFPASAEAPGQGPADHDVDRVRELGRLVLLVEDTDAVRATIRRQLERIGCKVLEASSAEAALTLLRETPAIDLVLTDIVLPGPAQGTEVAAAARKLRPALPIVFISGYPRAAVERGAATPPDIPLLSKPVSTAELGAALSAALGVGAPE